MIKQYYIIRHKVKDFIKKIFKDRTKKEYLLTYNLNENKDKQYIIIPLSNLIGFDVKPVYDEFNHKSYITRVIYTDTKEQRKIQLDKNEKIEFLSKNRLNQILNLSNKIDII